MTQLREVWGLFYDQRGMKLWLLPPSSLFVNGPEDPVYILTKSGMMAPCSNFEHFHSLIYDPCLTGPGPKKILSHLVKFEEQGSVYLDAVAERHEQKRVRFVGCKTPQEDTTV